MNDISPFGLEKLQQAETKDYGEYVSRLQVLVRLLDNRPYHSFGTVTFVWPEGKVYGYRSQLVRACMHWCRQYLCKNNEYLLAARVLLSVALPQVRRIKVFPTAAYPRELEVKRLLAHVLCKLHIKAFYRWEEERNDDLGPKMLEWAIRHLRFLGEPTERWTAMQYLYYDPQDNSMRQAMLRKARDYFERQKDTLRAARARSLILPLADAEAEISIFIEPVSACARLQFIKEPYVSLDTRQHKRDFTKKIIAN
jgi:hypothetical protein